MNGIQFLALVVACAWIYRYAIHDKLQIGKTMERTLNEIMGFDHVVEIHKDGTITEPTGIYCDAVLEVLEDGTDSFYLPEGWELLKGFTGQYSYNGPVMHASEYIGGGLERHIRESPGLYCVLMVNANCEGAEDGCSVEDGCYCEPAGWAIAFKETVESI